MPDPLVEERPGDLAALGLSSRNDLEPFEVTAEREEQEQAVEAAGESPPEPQVETPETKVEESESEENLLADYYADQKAPVEDESELTRLRQENERLRGSVENRIDTLEEQLKSPERPPAATGDHSESPLDSPVVRSTLNALREEDPSKYEAALVELVKQEAKREISADLEDLRSTITDKEQKDNQAAQKTAYQRQVLQAFADVKEQGGLAAQIIDDLEANRGTSLLGRKIQENPYIMLSRQGIRGAVMEVEAELRTHSESRHSEAGQVSPTVAASAGGGKSSKRGVSLDEEPNQKTPEEQILEDIQNVGRPSKRLPFMR